MLSNRECDIPVQYLHASYFNLPWGTDVYAKISATNIYGESPVSVEGNGGKLLTVPDEPHTLTEIVGIRGATRISLSWTKAAEEGGTAVIDF